MELYRVIMNEYKKIGDMMRELVNVSCCDKVLQMQ